MLYITLRWLGRAFQTDGPENEKARSPYFLRLVRGVVSKCEPPDLKVLDGVYGVKSSDM